MKEKELSEVHINSKGELNVEYQGENKTIIAVFNNLLFGIALIVQ
jgi:hypothetical protein